jgi:hypothetical protein
MFSMEGSAMLTIPDIAGFSLNVGTTEVYGASNNDALVGWSNFSGWAISVGEGANVGVSQNYGRGKETFFGEDFIDRTSNRVVRYRQSVIFGELNIPLFATPIDGSIFAGMAYTEKILGVRAPYWPIR